MLKYKILIILTALLFVVGASCQTPSFFKGKQDENVDDTFTGTNGLELSFLEGTPPNEVYQDTTFDIFVELQNKGALDINTGKIVLNIPAIFNVKDDKTRIIEILAGRENYPDGETRIIEWNGVEVKKTTVRNDARQTINVQACYDSSVEAQPEGCVIPRPGSIGIIDGECGTKGSKWGEIGTKKTLSGGQGGPIAISSFKTLSGGQGGPIAISSFIETVLKNDEATNKLVFRFEVNNVGGGDVINRDKVDDCRLTAKDKEKAEVEIEKVSWLGEEEAFVCTGGSGDENKNKVIMLNGKGTFKCTSPSVSNDQHYSLPLYIKMNYGYVKSLNKGFTLKKDILYAD